jgi:hypothetical protein
MLENFKVLNSDLRKILFTKNYLEFDENEKTLDSLLVGVLKNKTTYLSSIILDEKQKRDLLELCGFDSFEKWDLIYRASTDGMSPQAFHSKCDNKAKTLTVVKSTEGCIFGGYTDQAWDSLKQDKSDPNAFIFTLVHPYGKPGMFKISNKYKEAIYCHPNLGPTFGASKYGYDLCISLNKSLYSGAFIEKSYFASNFNNDFPAHYLTETDYFLLEELEVFQHSSAQELNQTNNTKYISKEIKNKKNKCWP